MCIGLLITVYISAIRILAKSHIGAPSLSTHFSCNACTRLIPNYVPAHSCLQVYCHNTLAYAQIQH